MTEFWERKVLGLTEGVGEPGGIKWDLAGCLLLAWVVVYFCICKGIKSSGKVSEWCSNRSNRSFFLNSIFVL